MLLLPLYALLAWYFCFRYRRQVWGFVALAVATLAVVTVAALDRRVRSWIGAEDHAFTSLQFLLWIEAGIVGGIGLFIVCLPRRGANRPCRRCGYELAGLEGDNPTCPECGLEHAVTKPRKVRA